MDDMVEVAMTWKAIALLFGIVIAWAWLNEIFSPWIHGRRKKK